MSQVINTNIASLTAQNNLNKSQSALNTAIERLSSGLRINSAKDDAAGLAIAQRFTSQINGLDQASRNANDGISFAQTAEGALGTIGDSLQRVRQLAVQAANDTNSSSDRQALNNEVSQLISEVNRVANSTQFNGQNVLDGSAQSLVFQVGANQGQTISVDGVDARGSQLGAQVADTHTSFDTSKISGVSGFTVNGHAVDLSGATDVTDVVAAINKVSADSGVTATKAASTSVDTGAYTGPSGAPATVTINGVDVNLADGADINAATKAINDVSGQTGVSASNDGTNITLTDSNGGAIDVTDDATTDVFGDAGITATKATFNAGIVLSTKVGETISTGGTNVTDLGIDSGSVSTSANILNDVNVLTRDDASNALATLDYALGQVNSERAQLGAVQNRFQSTISNLNTSSQNLDAARSRIQDTDFAAETAALTKNQVLQQAGTAVLAKANKLPNTVLTLLQ